MKEVRVNHFTSDELEGYLAESNLEQDFLAKETPITQADIRVFAKQIVEELRLNNKNSKIDQFHVLELFSDDMIIQKFLDHNNDNSDDLTDMLIDIGLAIQKIRAALVQELSHLIDPNSFALIRDAVMGGQNTHHRLHTPPSSHAGVKIFERGWSDWVDKEMPQVERNNKISAHTKLDRAHRAYATAHNGFPYPHVVDEKTIPADEFSKQHLVVEIPGLRTFTDFLHGSPTQDKLLKLYLQLIEASAWLEENELLLQDIKLENVGVYRDSAGIDTAVLFDLEGLIDLTQEGNQGHILTDGSNLPPECKDFFTTVQILYLKDHLLKWYISLAKF